MAPYMLDAVMPAFPDRVMEVGSSIMDRLPALILLLVILLAFAACIVGVFVIRKKHKKESPPPMENPGQEDPQ